MMNSKRMQHPCEEEERQGRCCAESKCSRAARKSYVNLLQDDAFLTPGEKLGGEAEGEQGPKTNVQLGVGTRNTAQHTNMHTQEGTHCGADCDIHQAAAAKLTTALSNLINQEESRICMFVAASECGVHTSSWPQV